MANSANPDQMAIDLDLHCLQRQGISRLNRAWVKGPRADPGVLDRWVKFDEGVRFDLLRIPHEIEILD